MWTFWSYVPGRLKRSCYTATLTICSHLYHLINHTDLFCVYIEYAIWIFTWGASNDMLFLFYNSCEPFDRIFRVGRKDPAIPQPRQFVHRFYWYTIHCKFYIQSFAHTCTSYCLFIDFFLIELDQIMLFALMELINQKHYLRWHLFSAMLRNSITTKFRD